MILKQFYLNCLAHASYLIGDEESHTAAVVDPQRDVDQYVVFAEEHRLQIAHVILTHFHADFIAGHLELRDRTGAIIYLGASAKAEYAFTPLADGDSVRFGRVLLKALETPGHTAESISILVYDLDRSATQAHAVLTGDTLFVGDVGRPDLRVALGWSAADLGGLLYESLRTKLLTLPDASLVYPAHGAGSLCGKAISQETFSTIGEQRRSNYALQPMSKAAFVELVTADQPEAPPYFTFDAVLNSKERPTLDETLARQANPMSLDQLLALQSVGAQILDVREPAEFAAAHLVGSVNIGLAGQFASWAGSLIRPEIPLLIVAEDAASAREARTRLARVGLEKVSGYLKDGVLAWHNANLSLSPTEQISADELRHRLGEKSVDLVIDVRRPAEWNDDHIEPAVNMALNHLAEAALSLSRDAKIAVVCAGGYRSSIASSILEQLGFRNISNVVGGMSAWNSSRGAA